MTYNTLIIGAGAAGLAAARVLHDAGYKILILEARNRIGGRIHTDYDFADFPIELGAEFIHGDNAVTHELVKQAGLHTLPVVRMGNLRWSDGKNPILPLPHLPENLRTMLTSLLHDYENLPEANLEQDCSLANYLRGRGWAGEALVAADVLLAQTCCASIETLSCYDLIREMQVDHAGHGEARIQEGYATWLESYQQGLPIEFNAPVKEIHWGGPEISIMSNGQMYQAKNCIITVPVSVLQSRAIRFIPSLSQKRQWAINAFRTEPATKLIYQFREQFWDDGLTFMAHAGLTARWWTPGYGRADAAIICCYITAERAQKIDDMPEAEALQIGLTELSTLLGVKMEILQAACLKSKRVSWATDPYALGGYAHVPPSMTECRVLLAQSENNQLFFAGEATAFDTNPQTVHGAIESGWWTATEVQAFLNR